MVLPDRDGMIRLGIWSSASSRDAGLFTLG